MAKLAIESDAPNLIIKEAVMKQIEGSSSYRIQFEVENKGKRTAENVEGTSYFNWVSNPVIPFLKIEISFINGIPPGESYSWYANGDLFNEKLPALYLTAKIKWSDPLFGKSKETKTFMKWRGIEGKFVHWTLVQASKEEKEKLEGFPFLSQN